MSEILKVTEQASTQLKKIILSAVILSLTDPNVIFFYNKLYINEL